MGALAPRTVIVCVLRIGRRIDSIRLLRRSDRKICEKYNIHAYIESVTNHRRR